MAPVDDSRHSLYAKAHEVRQPALDRFSEGRADGSLPGRYAEARVLEVDVKTALTPCGLPGTPWSLNPYLGCSHACAYCYVPDVAHLERPRWGTYAVVKRNLPRVLAKELRVKERRDVFLSSATDPYQPAEGANRITRRCLEQLVRVDWPLQVLTRSPLVTRDIDLFTEFSEVSVGLSVPTLDESLRRAIEPGAPPISARLRALKRLADAGLETFANLLPAYPLTPEVTPRATARAFAEAEVGTVHAGPWRYLEGVLPALAERLPADLRTAFLDAVQDPAYFDRMFRALDIAFRREGVTLRHRVSGPPRRPTGPGSRYNPPAPPRGRTRSGTA